MDPQETINNVIIKPSLRENKFNNRRVLWDLNKSPESSYEYWNKIDIDMEKPTYDSEKETLHQKKGLVNAVYHTDKEYATTFPMESLEEHNKSVEQLIRFDDESNVPNQNVLQPFMEGLKERSKSVFSKSLQFTMLENKPPHRCSSFEERIMCCSEFLKNGGSSAKSYDYCVRMIRQLECMGFIEADFRQKFLSWYNLGASLDERRVVSTYVSIFHDSPRSLAEQLIDSFSEIIQAKKTMK